MKFDILQHIGVCTDDRRFKNRPKDYNLELNIVSWNGKGPQYDLREWSLDHQRCFQGLSLTREEMDRMLQGYLRFERIDYGFEEICDDSAILIDKNGLLIRIAKLIAVLAPSENGYTKMLTITSWNRNRLKYDIRSWSADYSRMTKGMSLNDVEMRNFMSVYKTWISL